MEKPIYSLLWIACLLFLSGCEDRLFSDSQTEEYLIFLPLNYRIADENNSGPASPTRTTDDKQKVNNVWVFQFNGTEASSKLRLNPQYMETEGADYELSVGVIPSETPVRLLFVANTNQSAINWKAVKGVTTYQDILNVSGNFYQQEGATGGENDNIVMCGIVDGSISASGPALAPNLYRSVAKIKLNLTVAGGCKYKVISARLCNVPSNVYWTDYLRWKDAAPEEAPSVLSTRFSTYTHEMMTPIQAAESRELVWYMPRNARGAFVNDQQKSKNLIAPANASYVELYAIDETGGTGRYYRIFPGANLTNDFNIIPNTSYNLTFKITDGTQGEDARVQDIESVEFSELANCYILNPPEGGSPISFSIPVTERVNQFYDGKPSSDYATIRRENFSGFINNSTPWTCRVIWCDNPKLIDFKKYTEVSDKYLYLDSPTGDGDTKKRLKVVVPPLTKEQYGNLCIGIYDSENKCRWSWHLWVTDYNPDVPITIDPLKFTYAVPGGQVDRYAGEDFGYRSPKNNESTLTTYYKYVYETTSTDKKYLYRKSYLMDRHVGARSAYGTLNECVGCYYQFGRKDPFIFRKDLYDGDGAVINTVSSRTWPQRKAAGNNNSYGVTMSDAIDNPTTFYTGGNSWMGVVGGTNFETTTVTYIWHDTKLSAKTWTGQKSLFDPCPPGWQLPGWLNSTSSSFKDFTTASTSATSTSNARGLNYFSTHGVGCYYWPNIVKEENKLAPVDGIIFIPSGGKCTGSLEEDWDTAPLGGYVYLWLNKSNGPSTGASAKFSAFMGCLPNNSDYKANAFPARCIKTPVLP